MPGFQIWVALPKHFEQMELAFFHIGQEQILTWTDGDLQFKLVTGEAIGRKSPVPVFSKLYILEIKSKTKRTINIGDQLYGESGFYILEGTIENEGNIYYPKKLIVAKDSSFVHLQLKKTALFTFLEANLFAKNA